MKKEQIGEFVRCAKLAIATCEDQHLSMVSVDRDIQLLEMAIQNLSGREKTPAPAGFQVRNSYSKNEWTGCHGFATTQEAEECNSKWRYVYTAPPEVAELVKQNVELLHRIADLKSLNTSASKAAEQAHVALAESQQKVTDLEKQMQAPQAENDQLKGNK